MTDESCDIVTLVSWLHGNNRIGRKSQKSSILELLAGICALMNLCNNGKVCEKYY